MTVSDQPLRSRFHEEMERLTPALRNVVRCAAFQIKPVKYDTFTSMGCYWNIPDRDFRKFQEEWLQKGLLITEFKEVRLHKNNLRLEPALHALLLLELANQTPSEREEYAQFETQNIEVWGHQVVQAWIHETRDAIFDFLLYGTEPLFKSFNTLYNQTDYLEPLAAGWLAIPEMKKMVCYLPGEMLDRIFMKIFDRLSLALEPEGLETLKMIGSENESLDLYRRSFYGNLLLVPEFILKGKFGAIAELASTTTAPGLAALGLYAHYQGNYPEAVKLYERAIKEQGSVNFIGYILYDYAYIVALMQLNTPKSKARLEVLMNKKELKEKNEVGALLGLLIRIALFDIDIVRKVYADGAVPPSPLFKLLYLRIVRHYALRPITGEEEETLQHYAWVAEIPLPPYEHTELWERMLDRFLKPENEKSGAKGSDAASVSRIVYLVSEFGDVIPRLQKSKNGIVWSKGRNIGLATFKEGVEGMNDTDREIASLVRVTRGYNHRGNSGIEFSLNGAEVLSRLAGYPLVFSEENPSFPVEIAVEKPYLAILKKGDRFELESNVQRTALRELSHCVFEHDCRIRVIHLTPRQQEILTSLLRVEQFPLSAEEKLKALIRRLSSDIIIHSDLIASDEEIPQVEGDAGLTVQLLPVGDGFKAEFFVKPFGDLPPYCKPGIGPKTAMGKRGEVTCQAVRDLNAEKKNFSEVTQLFCDFEFAEKEVIQLPGAVECLDFLELAQSLPEGKLRVEWPEGVRLKVKGQATAGDFSLALKGKRGWFEMVGSLRYGKGGSVTLAELLDQMRDGSSRRFIALGNNEYLALSAELRKIAYTVASLSLAGKKDAPAIPEFAAPLLRDLPTEGVDFKSDASFEKLIRRIDTASRKVHKVPPQLQAHLRPYQEEGFRWMVRLSDWGAGACLADDMGLGKTVQTIALLLHKAAAGPSLVIAPASVLENWEQEIMRFAPALKCKVLNVGGDRNEMVAQAESYDVVLTTYGVSVSEEKLLSGRRWNVIVLDEAHTIKNKETRMSKAAMALQGEFRLLLTGTPVQNHLSEIWNLFRFMNPGLLGSFEQFHASFIVPIEVAHDEAKHKELKRLLSPFILRRTKSEVLPELPGKTEITLPVLLNKEEESFYEYLRNMAEERLKSDRTNTIQSLAEITRLRQAASNIALIRSDYTAESSKMNTFFELFEEMHENNHRALVFSQFTSHLALFRTALEKREIAYLYLDGSTPTAERGKLVKEFQTGTQPLFLISLKAGGLGLNLTAADFIIHLDPWWNPAVEDQASDRAYRLGQTRPVTVYRLISSNTIEEKIIRLHQTKKDLADSLLEGTNRAHKLTREELLTLLKK